jgi:hypothetical protein
MSSVCRLRDGLCSFRFAVDERPGYLLQCLGLESSWCSAPGRRCAAPAFRMSMVRGSAVSGSLIGRWPRTCSPAWSDPACRCPGEQVLGQRPARPRALPLPGHAVDDPDHGGLLIRQPAVPFLTLGFCHPLADTGHFQSHQDGSSEPSATASSASGRLRRAVLPHQPRCRRTI